MYAVQSFLKPLGQRIWRVGDLLQQQDDWTTAPQLPETRKRQLHPLNEDHVCLGRAVPHFARFAVFFAIQPVLGTVG